MKWIGRRQSENIEDRRGQGGAGLPGGPGMGFPRMGGRIPMGRARGGGIGIIGILIILAIAWFTGINPLALLTGGEGGLTPTGSQQQTGETGAPADEGGKFVALVLADTEDTFTEIFRNNGETYKLPTLVLFTGSTSSACGFASAASGPFYCPGDQRLYIDLAFYKELRDEFEAPGDFAQAYVIAHEVGHHIQNLLGILPKVQQQRQQVSEAESNLLSIRTELQADCFAGVWAHEADRKGILEVGDIDEGLNAAAQIGDDAIQKRMQGYVVPESFNHGTSEQRSRWFKRGYAEGDINVCDTFSASEV